jgi:hypothetical protein
MDPVWDEDWCRRKLAASCLTKGGTPLIGGIENFSGQNPKVYCMFWGWKDLFCCQHQNFQG